MVKVNFSCFPRDARARVSYGWYITCYTFGASIVSVWALEGSLVTKALTSCIQNPSAPIHTRILRLPLPLI